MRSDADVIVSGAASCTAAGASSSRSCLGKITSTQLPQHQPNFNLTSTFKKINAMVCACEEARAAFKWELRGVEVLGSGALPLPNEVRPGDIITIILLIIIIILPFSLTK